MKAVRFALIIAALVSWAGAARGQDSLRVRADSAEAERRACDSTIAASVADSELVVVRLAVRRGDGGQFPHPYPGLLMQEVAFRFRAPHPLRVPVFSAGPIEMRTLRASNAGQVGLREPVLNAVYDFFMHRDGSASGLEVLVPSHVAALDSVVMDAIKQTSAEKSLPFPLNELPNDSVFLQLRLTSAYAGRDPTLDLFASYFPLLPVVDAARIGPEPVPIFPKEELKAGMFGDVRFQVVVDNNGRPDLQTMELLHAPTRGFALSAVNTLATMRWTPARVGDCLVPQVVHVNIRFEPPDSAKVP